MPIRYIIVGNGVAGLSAAERIRKHDASGRILLFTDEPHGFYSKPGLAYVLSDLVPEKQIRLDNSKKLEDLGVEIRTKRVSAIRPDSRVVMAGGEEISYDVLLLAVGAAARKPELPGINLSGVVTLDNLETLKTILQLIRRARSAVVIGGGITALELAEGFSARKLKTHYLMRKARFWPSVLDEHESRIIEARLIKEGIHLYHGTEIARIIGKRGRVSAVETKEGKTIDCQILGVAIGIRPRLELARSAGLKIDRGILVDEFMQSSCEGIYAAGDVAQVYDSISNEHRLDSLWWPARQQGETAGANMAGLKLAYHKPVAINVTQMGGLTTTMIGAIGESTEDDDLVAIVRGDSETWRNPVQGLAAKMGNHNQRTRLKIGERHILGALVIGDQNISRALQQLIQYQVDISPIRGQLIEKPQAINSLIIPFWNEWRQRQSADQS